MSSDALLKISGTSLTFRGRGGAKGQDGVGVKALDDVSLDVGRGEIVGLVGESGSGKTTLARSVVRLVQPDSGTITFDNADVLSMKGAELRQFRRRVHLIYQDPYQSLNPRMTIGDIVAEPAKVYHLVPPGTTLRAYVGGLFESVGLSDNIWGRYPRQLSGGQRQRVAIARAFATSPEMLLADEVVSALDVSVQAQILNLLQRLCSESHVPMLFISHQLAVVAHLSDRVAVMYRGRIVELAPTATIFTNAQHPYTRRILAAHPLPSDTPQVHASIPAPTPMTADFVPGKGCRYRRDCPVAMPQCDVSEPALSEADPGHFVACYAATATKVPSQPHPSVTDRQGG